VDQKVHGTGTVVIQDIQNMEEIIPNKRAWGTGSSLVGGKGEQPAGRERTGIAESEILV